MLKVPHSHNPFLADSSNSGTSIIFVDAEGLVKVEAPALARATLETKCSWWQMACTSCTFSPLSSNVMDDLRAYSWENRRVAAAGLAGQWFVTIEGGRLPPFVLKIRICRIVLVRNSPTEFVEIWVPASRLHYTDSWYVLQSIIIVCPFNRSASWLGGN